MAFWQEPKRINGRYLTAPEFRNYASAYVQLFHDGAHFPAARSLLEATAGAHNGNAKHVAMIKYKVSVSRALVTWTLWIMQGCVW